MQAPVTELVTTRDVEQEERTGGQGRKRLRGREMERIHPLHRDDGRVAGSGAVPTSIQIEIVDVEDVPLAYLPGNATRVRVKAVGELHVG